MPVKDSRKKTEEAHKTKKPEKAKKAEDGSTAPSARKRARGLPFSQHSDENLLTLDKDLSPTSRKRRERRLAAVTLQTRACNSCTMKIDY